jgi:multimeric flavodoxin WrbA
MADTTTSIRAVALVCSLKPSPAPSSSALIAEHVLATPQDQGVKCDAVRCVDYTISPGVQADMGGDDQWPQLRDQVLGADILVLSTPMWLGHPSSVTQRVLERTGDGFHGLQRPRRNPRSRRIGYSGGSAQRRTPGPHAAQRAIPGLQIAATLHSQICHAHHAFMHTQTAQREEQTLFMSHIPGDPGVR